MNRRLGRGFDARRSSGELGAPARDFEAERRVGTFVYGPFEERLRFPAETFDFGGQALILNGGAVVTLVTMTVPERQVGVLREVVIYSTAVGGIADLTAFDVVLDAKPLRGRLTPGGLPASAILPEASLEPPVLTFNVRITSGQTLAIRAGRVGAVDPAAYTYRARVRGWLWPKHKRAA